MDERMLHKPGECAYCGDAPVNHTITYMSGVFGLMFDSFFSRGLSWVPSLLIRAIDKALAKLLHLFVLVGAIKLSNDKDKATTLRSRVMWNEAEKRGIKMEQLVIFGKYTDNYRALINHKRGERYVYFNSLPVNGDPVENANKWDDKLYLKHRLASAEVPVPAYASVPMFNFLFKKGQQEFFERFPKPLIIKPRLGSRGRHTTTNIGTLKEFEDAVSRAKALSPQIVAEEYLEGYVCRATCVNGKLEGFYRAEGASVTGDGKQTVRELIEEKNNKKGERIGAVDISSEILDFIARRGFTLDSVVPEGERLFLSHRTGRLFGGATREMIDELHPSFVPVIERAASVINIPVLGFDCIIPDPENDASAQRWGVIECNTLPFIDLHYYALEGEPRNIAGLIWDYVCYNKASS